MKCYAQPWPAHVWKKNRNAYRVLLGKPDRKWSQRSLVATGRQENNTKMDLNGTGWKRMNWIHQDQDRQQW